MEKLYLLDAYALIFRGYYALIRAPRINTKGENTSAVFGFLNTLDEILTKMEPTHIGVAFDPKGGTFRHKIYPDYKAQREETPEAIRFAVPIIKEILNAYHIPILEVPNYEADDVIGTLSYQAGKRGIETYMITPDKDYAQLVDACVYMLRPPVKGKDYEKLGVEEVKRKYDIEHPSQVIDLLGLMGDAADNIPGCAGVGPKTAEKLLHDFGSVENLLAHTEQLKGALRKKVEEHAEDIRFSKQLATIVKDVPIELDMDALARKDMDKEAMRAILARLEFKALGERILNEAQQPQKNIPLQGDLFAEMTPSPTGTEQITKSQTVQNTPHFYYLVDTEKDIADLIRKLETADAFSLDTETTGTDPIDAELVGLSFSFTPHEAFYVPVPADQVEARRFMNQFKKAYENTRSLKIGQNIKYDMQVLKNYDIEVDGPMFDTMIAHYLLHPELRHNMDDMAEHLLHYRTVHIEELIGPKGKKQKNMRDLSPKEVYEYAAEDADITLQLKEVLAPLLKQQEAEKLFQEIEMPLVPVLAYMERCGVRIDTEALKETSRHFTLRMKEIEEEIFKEVGERFNISSPRQVGTILFEKLKLSEKPKKTKTGNYVTSEEVLQSLKAKSPVVEKILDYRGLKKLLSTYVDSLPTLINPRTGRIHTSYNQTVAATGRLSSSNPNLQNIPIRDDDGKEIRKVFIPDEGCLFYSADYSQVELRIMAHLSNDPNMVEAFNEGKDIHASTAAKIYKVPLDEVTKTERAKAKTANFGIIYGISAFGLSERLGIPRKEAKELIDGYFQTYPQIKAYMEASIAKAREKGYTETIMERRCYLPDINSHNAVVRGYAERNAINAPIQGSAADIIKKAMIAIYRRFKEEGIRSKMLIQVHDELDFSVYPEEKEKVEQIVLSEMENAYKMRVPLVADGGWGKNWLEAH